MITKKQFVIFIVALLVVVAFVVIGFRTTTTPVATPDVVVTPALWPSREIEKVSADQKTSYAEITASYPKTESETINGYFNTFVGDHIKQFIEDTSWAGELQNAESGALMLDISYKSVQATTAHTYIFTVNSYTGGAHGMQFRKTFSFNAEGRLLTIGSLFTSGISDLPAFAKIVQKELLKRDGAQADWIADGADGKEDNYQSFIITDSGVTVLFDPYQIAPWSDGAIDIAIPTASFKSIANKELFVASQ
jgi:hypothetical protein